MAGLGFESRELALALDDLGIVAGDLVYFQICAEPGPRDHIDDACAAIYRALREAVGEEGTILAPAFTFSFCRNQPFDPAATPAEGGPYNTFAAFPEYLRKRPSAVRSHDPIFSVAGEGPAAKDLLSDLPHECLGHDCVFDRLRQANGKIVIMGIGLFEAVFRHYVESVMRVPWRYDKLFSGRIIDGGETRREVWTYNVRIWDKAGDPTGQELEATALAEGIGRERKVGDTFLQMTPAQPFYELCVRELLRDPWSTATGPAGDAVEIERKRIGFSRTAPTIPRTASMAQISDALRPLKRDLLSAGYDAALAAFATRAPLSIERWRTGEAAGGWVIPEEWNCRSAHVETLDGRRVLEADGADSRLRSYSRSFDGIVERADLLARVEIDESTPDDIPFSAGWLDREWAFCATQGARAALNEPRYRVAIDTSFSMGELTIGAWRLDGESAETIVLSAHLTRTRDDAEMIDGAIVATELMRALSARDQRRYSYLLLLSPEPIGSAPYFERHAPEVKQAILFGSLGAADVLSAGGQLQAEASAFEARGVATTVLNREAGRVGDRGVQLGEALKAAFELIDAIEKS